MKRFRSILYVVGTGPSESALARTVELAENHQAHLSVFDVAEPVAIEPGAEPAAVVVELQRLMQKEREQRLDTLLDPYRDRLTVGAGLLTGTPFLEIIRAVQRGGHDLVVRVAEQPSWLGRLLGSDDMHLLRKCPCPVWMMRAYEPEKYRRIIATVDVGDSYPASELETRNALNRQVLETAAGLAASHFAELHVVHMWDAPGESAMRGVFVSESEAKIAAYIEHVRQHHADRLDALMNEITRKLGAEAVGYLNPHLHLIKGHPRRDLAGLTKRIAADVVVMGTVARTGIPGLVMGNTAEAVLNRLDCSVLAIKPPGFVSPVTPEE